MSRQVERLGSEDYRDAIDFINMVFSMSYEPHDFPHLLPAFYQPTPKLMKCHFVLREQGKILALVGVYPTTVVVGETSLKVARIGAVSTHPAYRGQGLMQQLMDHCMTHIRRHYDVAWLSGLRHRYGYYGFEKCGYSLTYRLGQNTLKHTELTYPSLHWREVKPEEAELIAKLEHWHTSKSLYCQRPAGSFLDHSRNWKNRLVAAFEGTKPRGYLVTNAQNTSVTEMGAQDEGMAIQMVLAFLAENGQSQLRIHTSPTDVAVISQLNSICEEVQVTHSGNWHIVNWEKTLNALLSQRVASGPMVPATVTVEIAGYGTFQMILRSQTVECQQSPAVPDLRLDAPMAMRLLFGPLPPSHTITLPASAAVLNAWCPLPLYLPVQDHA